MAGAIVSQKSKFLIKIGNTYVQVKGLLDFNGIGGGAPAVIDTTDLDSDAKEKAIGLSDEGSPKLSFNLIETDAGQIGLLAARGTRALTSFQLVLANNKQRAFDAYVKTFEVGGGVDKVLSLSVDLEISGPITVTPVAP